MQHLNLHITGKVQGVFYRESTKKKARELGVTGFVRNEPDGSVYAEAEGPEEALNELVTWCYEGSEEAVVSSVTVTEGAIVGYTIFERR